LSDYRIARELKMEMPNVKRSRKNTIKKIEDEKADLKFVDGLISAKQVKTLKSNRHDKSWL
jgi:hypothetical protein